MSINKDTIRDTGDWFNQNKKMISAILSVSLLLTVGIDLAERKANQPPL